MRFEMRVDKVQRSGDRLFVILEGNDCSLRGYIDPSTDEVPDFGQVYVVEVGEADGR